MDSNAQKSISGFHNGLLRESGYATYLPTNASDESGNLAQQFSNLSLDQNVSRAARSAVSSMYRSLDPYPQMESSHKPDMKSCGYAPSSPETMKQNFGYPTAQPATYPINPSFNSYSSQQATNPAPFHSYSGQQVAFPTSGNFSLPPQVGIPQHLQHLAEGMLAPPRNAEEFSRRLHHSGIQPKHQSKIYAPKDNTGKPKTAKSKNHKAQPHKIEESNGRIQKGKKATRREKKVLMRAAAFAERRRLDQRRPPSAVHFDPTPITSDSPIYNQEAPAGAGSIPVPTQPENVVIDPAIGKKIWDTHFEQLRALTQKQKACMSTAFWTRDACYLEVRRTRVLDWTRRIAETVGYGVTDKMVWQVMRETNLSRGNWKDFAHMEDVQHLEEVIQALQLCE